ncbi:glutamyl-tRNA reductase [Quadrisphaera sp. DSM 44207]|nr:glutamyl-tRNA reductase [Quadrisphaera sp. DSM 44207]
MGMSHRTSPISVLERAALDGTGARQLAAAACSSGSAAEAVVLATCNRLEVYAEVDAFHAGVRDLAAAISGSTGLPVEELGEHLYFHHGERAVDHLFTVAGGLDSMAVGESQVLGQVRAALRRGQEDGTVGRTLDHLLQQALRVGKRVQTETGLDRAGHSLVEAALDGAEAVVGDLAAARALVVGAGSMSALAATTLHRRGVARVTVANRTPARARRLAEAVGGDAVPLTDEAALRAALAAADVVVSCTGAVGHVLDARAVAAARAERPGRGGAGPAPQLVVDLALPRDVDPAVAALEGVVVVGLAELRERLARTPSAPGAGLGAGLALARAIVEEEVLAHQAEQRAAAVAPTVTALRSLARDVVDAEVGRLRSRLGADADPRTVAEAERAVHRVVDKLLHTPTVRVKALAADGEHGASYAAALRELFGLEGESSLDSRAGAVGALASADVSSSASVAQVLAAVPAPVPTAPPAPPADGGAA